MFCRKVGGLKFRMMNWSRLKSVPKAAILLDFFARKQKWNGSQNTDHEPKLVRTIKLYSYPEASGRRIIGLLLPVSHLQKWFKKPGSCCHRRWNIITHSFIRNIKSCRPLRPIACKKAKS